VIEVGKNEGQSMRVAIAWVFGWAISLVSLNPSDSFTIEGYRARKRWVTQANFDPVQSIICE